MSNYDLSKMGSADGNNSKFIRYGSDQVLKITGIELKFSKNTGSPKAILSMETEPVTTEGFLGVDDAKGRVGRVACGIYMKDESSKKIFLQKMKTIAIALGLEDEVNEIRGDSFEKIVKQIEAVLVKGGKYARYTIFAEEYPKVDGKVGIVLMFPRTNFVEALDTNAHTIVAFDKNNPFHYKAIKQGAVSGDYNTGSTNIPDDVPDDLPF